MRNVPYRPSGQRPESVAGLWPVRTGVGRGWWILGVSTVLEPLQNEVDLTSFVSWRGITFCGWPTVPENAGQSLLRPAWVLPTQRCLQDWWKVAAWLPDW